MKFYYAPLEGMTGYVYRNVHREYYKDVDKYFAPFIVTSLRDNFRNKDMKDVSQECNKTLNLVPQLLTNSADEFIYTVNKLLPMGYDEININLGCPSKTVISKNRGSGFLSKVDELDGFFKTIFREIHTMERFVSDKPIKVSVKTRIGKDSPEEFKALMEVYNTYPLEELIIHPRVQKDFYNNRPNHEVFLQALSMSKNSICYNGDINTVEDYKYITELAPTIDKIMIGRGLIANPALIREIKTGEKISKVELKTFLHHVQKEYENVMSGEVNVLYKMKEIWLYMIHMFEDSEKYGKKIKKSNHLSEYEQVVNELFLLKNLK